MSNDPAFLFYPGDYLRDTQILSESTQVAYDRIMCEHMRNICISQRQLKFLTKRLSEDECEELMHVLTQVNGGYQIRWVAESINKRRAYSESRSKNRKGKSKKDMKNISKTYERHMEIENEIENVNNDIIESRAILSHADAVEALKKDVAWLESFTNEPPRKYIQMKIGQFPGHCERNKIPQRNIEQTARHFNNWVRREWINLAPSTKQKYR